MSSEWTKADRDAAARAGWQVDQVGDGIGDTVPTYAIFRCDDRAAEYTQLRQMFHDRLAANDPLYVKALRLADHSERQYWIRGKLAVMAFEATHGLDIGRKD